MCAVFIEWSIRRAISSPVQSATCSPCHTRTKNDLLALLSPCYQVSLPQQHPLSSNQNSFAKMSIFATVPFSFLEIAWSDGYEDHVLLQRQHVSCPAFLPCWGGEYEEQVCLHINGCPHPLFCTGHHLLVSFLGSTLTMYSNLTDN